MSSIFSFLKSQYLLSLIQRSDANGSTDFLNPAVSSAVKVDFVQLADTTQAISRKFDDVYFQVLSFDSTTGRSYGPTWAGFKQTWHRALGDSTHLADTIATSAEAFRKDVASPVSKALSCTAPSTIRSALILLRILPKDYAQKTMDKGACLLGEYITKAEAISKEAKALSDLLSNLQASVQRFGNTIQDAASSVTNDYQSSINGIQDAIRNIQADLERIRGERAAMTIAGGTIGGVGLIASIFCPILAPVFAAATAGLLIHSDAPIRDREREINTFNDKIQRTREAVDRVQRLRSQLTSDHLSVVIEGMASLETAWNAVNSDFLTIKKYLQDALTAGDSPTPLPAIMTMYLKNANTLYYNLSKSLRGYMSCLAAHN